MDELIKEEMERHIRRNILNLFDCTANPFKALKDLFITDDTNHRLCLKFKYIGDDFNASIYNKIHLLYDAIIGQIDETENIEFLIQIDTEHYTKVIIYFESNIVFTSSIKTTSYTWNDMSSLHEYMHHVLTTIMLNIQMLPVQDELDLLHENRVMSGSTGHYVSLR